MIRFVWHVILTRSPCGLERGGQARYHCICYGPEVVLYVVRTFECTVKKTRGAARSSLLEFLRLPFNSSILVMAPTKETSVDLCKRTNAQGNTIAIRILEYLSTAKTPIHGFESLAREFIELCQVR
jgi:hypothetical protein